jgi:3-deoxy-D-manno-octulosonate 8-phosphate phosphatase (KDO 8-P phosphatase)
MNSHLKPSYTCFVVDVDGVMTTGHFMYTAEGKVMKIFGPEDNDGLSLLKPYLEIPFIKMIGEFKCKVQQLVKCSF